MTHPGRALRRLTALDERLTIRGRLVMLLLSLSIPFIAYYLASSWMQARDARESARQEMVGVARLSAARLDDHVSDIRQLLTIIAQVAEPDARSAASNNALLRSIARTLPPQTFDVGVWTLAGENVGYLGRDTPLPAETVLERRFFRDAVAGKELSVEAPVLARGRAVATFAVAVEREGRLIGVVSASAELEELTQLIEPDKSLPAGAVITVVDVHRTVIARSIESTAWIGKNLSSMAQPSGNGEQREGRSADGVDRIAGFTGARRVPWLVYVGVPSEAALLPIRRRHLENIAVGSLMLCLGFAVAMYFGKRIAQPLQRLSEDAGVLASGDLNHRSDVRQRGEIGQLAHALNGMADALQDRTSALQSSRAQLKEITDNLPVMISYLDPQQRFQFANSAYRNWIGFEPEQMVGRSLCEVYGAEVYALIRHHIENALQGHRTVYERDLEALHGCRRIEVTLIPHLSETQAVLGLFVLMQDVTEDREFQAAQQRSEERLALALEGAGTALFDWDISDDRLYQSAQLAAMRGAPAKSHVASIDALRESIHPDEREGVMAGLSDALNGEVSQFDAEFRVSTDAGSWVWLRSKGRVVERDAEGNALRMTGTYSDISLRKIAEGRLRLLAEFDSLTGLPNRALFHDRLEQALVRHRRTGKGCALLFLDIDHFKLVNDNLGHDAGDQLLVDFAQTLSTCVRACDTVARLAGDEFTVILENLQGIGDATRISATILGRTKRSIPLETGSITVSTSIGIAYLNGNELDAHALLRRADAALYEAKRAGRNRVSVSH